jgi:molecular chaperone DnaK
VSDPIVGIDLGTSNTVVAHADAQGEMRVLADESGYKIHPSVVSFHPNGGVVVGAAAKQRKVIDPQNTIYSIKRLIGRAYSSPEVQTAKERSPFQIKEGANQLPMIATRAGEFAIPEISAIVLDHARNIAAAQLETDVNRAVVTVPASFNDAQRSATATAGAIAGLTVVRVLNEPTAAALAYGNARDLRQIIAVYDFGGGTFDVTILKLEDQVYEVLGTSGDTFLGGDDLDERIVDKMVAKFLADNRVDLRTNEVSMMRMRAVAEQTKIELSRRSRAVVRIDEIAYGPRGAPMNLQIEITRDEFVAEVADIIDRTFPVCREALQLARLGIDRIDDVILVGGTTKIPYVRDQVSKFFSKMPRAEVNPEDAVALGAALQAMSLERILARPTRGSVKIKAPVIEDEDTLTNRAESETTDAEPITTPGTDLTRPRSGEYSSRSVPADRFEGRTPPPPRQFPRAPTPPPPPPDQPIGRMTRPQGYPITPPAGTPAQQKTLFGVPAGPHEEPTKPAAPSPLAPPPIPANRTQHLPITPRPPAPPQVSPASTQPMAPTTPIAPPTAPTLMALDLPSTAASTAKGMGPAQSMDLPPATTARGLQPPPLAPAPLGPGSPGQAGYPLAARAPVVIEVTPRSLGIGTVAGFCEELIRRNSKLPTETRKLFTTSRDSQDIVRIVVCQGESRRLDNNVVIGDLRLENLPPRPRGETSIEVTFALDASGILNVRARDAQTGKEQSAQLDVVGSVPQQDVAGARERIQQLRR